MEAQLNGINPNISNINKVLVIVAHPDDIDYGCAGTVAWLTSQGVEVSYCLATSGDAGGDNDGLSNVQRSELREKEQRDAGKIVGVDKIHFLRLPDGAIEADLGLREKLTRIIRKEQPDLVITQSPQRRYDRIYASHPDHLATGEATFCAVYPDARNPNAFAHLLDEDYLPHLVPNIWVMADENPDTFINITELFDQKIEALFKHESQIDDQGKIELMVRDWTANMAQEARLESGQLCEAFKHVNTA
jgi:LmbE family N-acetylglucosaminyl deacetylase